MHHFPGTFCRGGCGGGAGRGLPWGSAAAETVHSQEEPGGQEVDKGLDAVGGGGDQRLTGVPGVVGGDAAPPGECTDCHSGEPPPTHWFTPQMPTNAGWGQAEAGNSGQAFQASAGPVPGPPPAASRVCTNRKLVRSRDWTQTQYRSERTGLATHRPGARCRSGTPPFTEETAAKTLFLNSTRQRQGTELASLHRQHRGELGHI